MNKMFNGVCKHCLFVWVTAGRLPNYCPECGKKLFDTAEEMLIAKGQFTSYEERAIKKVTV